MENNKRYQKDVHTLLLGVLMGVMGGMFGSILDRYFFLYGKLYEAVVAILLFGTVVAFMRKFNF